MRKRFLPFFLTFLLLSMVFTGCSAKDEPAAGGSGNRAGHEAFLLYLAFVMAFSLVTGLIVNVVI